MKVLRNRTFSEESNEEIYIPEPYEPEKNNKEKYIPMAVGTGTAGLSAAGTLLKIRKNKNSAKQQIKEAEAEVISEFKNKSKELAERSLKNKKALNKKSQGFKFKNLDDLKKKVEEAKKLKKSARQQIRVADREAFNELRQEGKRKLEASVGAIKKGLSSKNKNLALIGAPIAIGTGLGSYALARNYYRNKNS